MSENRENNYDDIIHLERPISKKYPKMPLADRAAQFAPFAALTGLDAAVKETARVTSDELEISEEEMARLDERLQYIRAHMKVELNITILHFVPDTTKSGGSYISHTGSVKKIDEYERMIIFQDKTRIPISHIREITIQR